MKKIKCKFFPNCKDSTGQDNTSKKQTRNPILVAEQEALYNKIAKSMKLYNEKNHSTKG